jgi:hypothetical protein
MAEAIETSGSLPPYVLKLNLETDSSAAPAQTPKG